MKKVVSILRWAMFIAVALYPLGRLVAFFLGYTFKLNYVSGCVIAISVLSLANVILEFVFKFEEGNEVIKVLLAILTPLSLISYFLMLGICPDGWNCLCLMVVPVCCCFLTVCQGKPFVLKSISLVLSAVMLIILIPSAFLGLLFGGLSSDEVIQTVESPSGAYYAEVVANNQGGLGGSTIVKVYKDTKLDFFLFEFEDKPQKVYVGNWGEFYGMDVYWNTDKIIVIDGREYKIN